jgi:hypothetical protein
MAAARKAINRLAKNLAVQEVKNLAMLLAADPKRLLELEHYWLIPIPQQESK